MTLLIARTTPIKAVHFAELRQAINRFRPFNWQEPDPVIGGMVRLVVLTELRNALGAAYRTENRTPPGYEPITTGVIKASHLSELRKYLRFLEGLKLRRGFNRIRGLGALGGEGGDLDKSGAEAMTLLAGRGLVLAGRRT
ncbi:MAG TPA: hypothetical protein VLT62_21485 [Candidatus Methylomirabilis sp.]|nr:hypothetical protein [Candidatus Methylomirabilis sp.]